MLSKFADIVGTGKVRYISDFISLYIYIYIYIVIQYNVTELYIKEIYIICTHVHMAYETVIII